MATEQIPPIIKVATLACFAQQAFQVFTTEISDWWPLETHSMADRKNGEIARAVTIEPHRGGRVYETCNTGKTYDWGEVLAHDLGRRFAMRWALGRKIATRLDVRFEPLTKYACRATLTHSGWDAWGDEGLALRQGYDAGWTMIFNARFVAAAEV